MLVNELLLSSSVLLDEVDERKISRTKEVQNKDENSISMSLSLPRQRLDTVGTYLSISIHTFQL